MTAPEPYWADDLVTLYHADCRDALAWLGAAVLVTDPPYGRNWHSGAGLTNSDGRGSGKPHTGIQGDQDTTIRDWVLDVWGDRPAVVFGDLLLAPPAAAVQTLIYAKPPDAGMKGAHAGYRRDAEAVYLLGAWPTGIGGRSSILTSNGRVAGPRGLGIRYGHPHAKPVDVLETLIAACPPGKIADPFAGSGSTLVAARNLGRRAIGVEIHEPYCQRAAERLRQDVLIEGTL